jgi:hypothetical protein
VTLAPEADAETVEIPDLQPAMRPADAPARTLPQGAARVIEPATAADPRPASAPAGRGLRVTGLAFGAAGVTALGVGVGFGIRAKRISDAAAGWTRYDPTSFDRGRAAARNMVMLTSTGAATLIAGGVLYYLGRRVDTIDGDRAHSIVTFAPTIGRGEISIAAVGRFQ